MTARDMSPGSADSYRAKADQALASAATYSRQGEIEAAMTFIAIATQYRKMAAQVEAYS